MVKGHHIITMDKLLQTLRAQSWERAKAELACIEQADYPPDAATGGKEEYRQWADKCSKRRVLIQDFILAIEQDELYR